MAKPSALQPTSFLVNKKKNTRLSQTPFVADESKRRRKLWETDFRGKSRSDRGMLDATGWWYYTSMRWEMDNGDNQCFVPHLRTTEDIWEAKKKEKSRWRGGWGEVPQPVLQGGEIAGGKMKNGLIQGNKIHLPRPLAWATKGTKLATKTANQQRCSFFLLMVSREMGHLNVLPTSKHRYSAILGHYIIKPETNDTLKPPKTAIMRPDRVGSERRAWPRDHHCDVGTRQWPNR